MRRSTTACVALALALSGCTNDPPTIRAVTWNVGLAEGDVDYTAERAPYVVDAVSGLDADVVCLQELWSEEDFEAVRDATSDRYTALRSDPMPAESSCSEEELTPLAACAMTECDGLSGAELQDCAFANCADELAELSSGCITCLADVVGAGGGVEEIYGECAGVGGTGYLFEGSFDTALLTRLPVIESSSLMLGSFLVRASVEHALLDGPAGEVHVFCTHLASEIPEFTYQGEHGDWKGEQLHQIQQLLDFIEDETAGGGRVLVLGDLNTGPAIASVEAKWPEHYAMLPPAPLENLYAAQDDVACTSCPDNSFHDAGSHPKLIDHVLSRGARSARGERLFTELVEIQVDGSPVTTHLSDHYGLGVTFEY